MPKPSSRLSDAVGAQLTQQDTRHKSIPLLDDLNQAATALSNDLAVVLAERVEEISTSNPEFRAGLYRAFLRVLTLAKRQADKDVLVFNEAIPGFTVILFKKEPLSQTWQPTGKGKEPPLDDPRQSPAMAASAMVIDAFVARTRNRVLVIESSDALFVFFPAADIKRNLKDMGFYHTD
jgi:hypothetical protein